MEEAPFTEEEDKFLLLTFKKCANASWSDIATCMKGRSEASLKKRYYQLINKSPAKQWTPEEDQKLLDLVKKVGYAWSVIAPLLNNRSDVDVKNRYSIISKRRDSIEKKAKQPPVEPKESQVSLSPPKPIEITSKPTSPQNSTQNEGNEEEATETIVIEPGPEPVIILGELNEPFDDSMMSTPIITTIPLQFTKVTQTDKFTIPLIVSEPIQTSAESQNEEPEISSEIAKEAKEKEDHNKDHKEETQYSKPKLEISDSFYVSEPIHSTEEKQLLDLPYLSIQPVLYGSLMSNKDVFRCLSLPFVDKGETFDFSQFPKISLGPEERMNK